MASQIKLRRDTSTNWWNSNTSLATGEPGYETDTGKLKLGRTDISGNQISWRQLEYVSTGYNLPAISSTRISSYSFTQDNQVVLYISGTNISGTANVRISDGATTIVDTQISSVPNATYNINLPTGTYFITDKSYNIDILNASTGSSYLSDVIIYSPSTNFQVTVEPKTCSPKSIALTYTYTGPTVDIQFILYDGSGIILTNTSFITLPRNYTPNPTPIRYFIQSPSNLPIGNCRLVVYKRNGSSIHQSSIPVRGITVSNLYVVSNTSFHVEVSNVSSYLITQSNITFGLNSIWVRQSSPQSTLSSIDITNSLQGGNSFSSYGTYKFNLQFEDQTTLETPFIYNRSITNFQPQITESGKFNVYATLDNVTSITLNIKTSSSSPVESYTYSTALTSSAFTNIGVNRYSFTSESQSLTGTNIFLYNTQYTFEIVSGEDAAVNISSPANPLSKIVNSLTDTGTFTNTPLLLSGNIVKLQYYWKGPAYNNVKIELMEAQSSGAVGTPTQLTNGSDSTYITLPYSNDYTAREINIYKNSSFIDNYYYAIRFTVGTTTITSNYINYYGVNLELIQFEGSFNTRIKKKLDAPDSNRVYLYLRIDDNIQLYANYLTLIDGNNYLHVATATNVTTSQQEQIIRFTLRDPTTGNLPTSIFPDNTFSYAYGRTYLIGMRKGDGSIFYSNSLEYRFTSPGITNLSITNAGDIVSFYWTHGSFVNSSDTRIRYYLSVNNTDDNYINSVDTGIIDSTYTTSTGSGILITNASYTLSTDSGGGVRAVMSYTVSSTTGLTVGSRFIATGLVPNALNQEGIVYQIRSVSLYNIVDVNVTNPPGLISGLPISMNTGFPGLTAIKNTTVSFRSDLRRQTNLLSATANSDGTRILYEMTTLGGQPTLALTTGQYVSILGFTNSNLNISGIVDSFYNNGSSGYNLARFYVIAAVPSGISESYSTGTLPVIRLNLNPNAYYYIKAQHTGTTPGFTSSGYSQALSGDTDICNSLALRYYRAEIKGITVVYNSLTSAIVTVQRAGQLTTYDLQLEKSDYSPPSFTPITNVYNNINTSAQNVSTNVSLSDLKEFQIGKYYRPVIQVYPLFIPQFYFGRTSAIVQYIYDTTVLNSSSNISFSTYGSGYGTNGTKLHASFPYKGPPARVYFVLRNGSNTIYTSNPKILPNCNSTQLISLTNEALSSQLNISTIYNASLYFNVSQGNELYKLDFDITKTYTYVPSSYTLTIADVTENTVTATFTWIGPDIIDPLSVTIINVSTYSTILTSNPFYAGISSDSTSITFTLLGGNTFQSTNTYRLQISTLPDLRADRPYADFIFSTLQYTPNTQTSLFKDKSTSLSDLGVAETRGTVFYTTGSLNVNLTIQLLKYQNDGSSSTVSTQQYTSPTNGLPLTTTFTADLLDIGSYYNIRYTLTSNGKTPLTGLILSTEEIYDPSGYDILVFAGQSNMDGFDNASFYGTTINGVIVYKAATSVPIPYEYAMPPQITDNEKTILQDSNSKNVKILKETARNSSGDTTAYSIDDATGPFRSSEFSDNAPLNNINIPYQFTKYYINHTPSLVDLKRRVCVIVRPKSESTLYTGGEWTPTLTTRLIAAINYVRSLTTYAESPAVDRQYTCNRIKVLCWLQGESDAPANGTNWVYNFIRPTVCNIMADTVTPYNSANFLLGNILSMHVQRFCDIGYYSRNAITSDVYNNFLNLSKDIDKFNTITNIATDSYNIIRYKPRSVSSFGLHAIDEEVPDASINTTSPYDLDKGTSVHFSARSLRIYARRFFNAFLDSIGRSTEKYSEPLDVLAPATLLYNTFTKNMIWNSTATSYIHTNNPVGYLISAVIGQTLTADSRTLDSTLKYAIISEYANSDVVYVPYLRNTTSSRFGITSSELNATVIISGVTLTGVQFYRSKRSYIPVAGTMDITFDNKQLTSSIGTFIKNITSGSYAVRSWNALSYESNLSFNLEPLIYSASLNAHSNVRAKIKPLPPILGVYHDSFTSSSALTSSNTPSLVDFNTLQGWINGYQDIKSVVSSNIIGTSNSNVIVSAGLYPANIGGLSTKNIANNSSVNTYSLIGKNIFYDTAINIQDLTPVLSRDAFPYSVGLWDPGDGRSQSYNFGSGYLYNRIRGSLIDDMLFLSAARITTVSKTPGGNTDNCTKYGYQYAIISQLGANTDPVNSDNLRTQLGISNTIRVPYFSLVNTGTAIALRIINILPQRSYRLSYWFSVQNGRVPYFNSGSDSTNAMYLTNYLPVTIRTANPSNLDNIIYVTGVDVASGYIYISSVTGYPYAFSKIYFETSFNGVVAFTTYYISWVTSIYANLYKVRISSSLGVNILLNDVDKRGLSIKGKLQRYVISSSMTLSAWSSNGDITVTNIPPSIQLANNSIIYITSDIEFELTAAIRVSVYSISSTSFTFYTYLATGLTVGQYLTITKLAIPNFPFDTISNARITSINTSPSRITVQSTTYSNTYPSNLSYAAITKSTLPAGVYFIRNPQQSQTTATIGISLASGGSYLPLYGNASSINGNIALYTGESYSNLSTEFLRYGYPSAPSNSTTEQQIHFSNGTNSSTGNKSMVYVHGSTSKTWDGSWTKLNMNFTTPTYNASDSSSSAYLQFGPLPMIRSNVPSETNIQILSVNVTNTYVEYTTSSKHSLSTGDIVRSVSGFTGTQSHLNFSFEKPVKYISDYIFQVANDFAIYNTAYGDIATPLFPSSGTSPVVTVPNTGTDSYHREFIDTTFNFAAFEFSVI